MKNEGGSSLKNFQQKPIKSKELRGASTDFPKNGRNGQKFQADIDKPLDKTALLLLMGELTKMTTAPTFQTSSMEHKRIYVIYFESNPIDFHCMDKNILQNIFFCA